MYASVCGAIYRGYMCANLGFIVHTLCHYREIVATAAGVYSRVDSNSPLGGLPSSGHWEK